MPLLLEKWCPLWYNNRKTIVIHTRIGLFRNTRENLPALRLRLWWAAASGGRPDPAAFYVCDANTMALQQFCERTKIVSEFPRKERAINLECS